MVTVWGIGFRELGHGNHTAGFEREGTRNLAGLHCRLARPISSQRRSGRRVARVRSS